MVIVGFILVSLLITFLADVIVAWFVWWVAPLTGIVALDALTFWQTFWTVVVISVVVRAGTVSTSD